MLNVDAKILAKVLATRFSTVLGDLIQVDQIGFIPMKGTNINIRHLFLNLSVPHDNMGTRVIALLDAEKAFDSVECTYLRFGLGLSFCSNFSFFIDLLGPECITILSCWTCFCYRGILVKVAHFLLVWSPWES